MKRINTQENGQSDGDRWRNFSWRLSTWPTAPQNAAPARQVSLWATRRQHLHLQVLLSSLLRQAGSKGLMCCSFWARTTWILGTKEAGGLCTLCSSAMSVHSIGSSSEEASLPREDRARFRVGSSTHVKVTSVSENKMGTQAEDSSTCTSPERTENAPPLRKLLHEISGYLHMSYYDKGICMYMCVPNVTKWSKRTSPVRGHCTSRSDALRRTYDFVVFCPKCIAGI